MSHYCASKRVSQRAVLVLLESLRDAARGCVVKWVHSICSKSVFQQMEFALWFRDMRSESTVWVPDELLAEWVGIQEEIKTHSQPGPCPPA